MWEVKKAIDFHVFTDTPPLTHVATYYVWKQFLGEKTQKQLLVLALIVTWAVSPGKREKRLDGRILFGSLIWLNMQIFPSFRLTGKVGKRYIG